MRRMCPECAALCSLTAWQNTADQREFDRILAELPWSVSRYCLHYLALFRPRPASGPGKGLLMPKALRLIGEIQQLVAQSHLQWKRQPARPIDAAIWGQAMERMLERPPEDLPVDSHGYLKAIAYKLADKADRKQEVKHNRAERDGSLRREKAKEREAGEASKPAGIDLDPVMTKEQMRAIRKKNMGR